LYDEVKDPQELRNLASDPKYAAVLTEMRQWLVKMKAEGTAATSARGRP
jgi:hypothetical protein